MNRETLWEGPLNNEAVVGMWRDRQDMSDSNAWVRVARQHEWERTRRLDGRR